MKVNLGCGYLPLDGYVNVDKYVDTADVHGDALTVSFDGVEDTTAIHFLEHLNRADALTVLQHAKQWSLPGGTLHVEVPDMGEILDRGTSDPNWPTYIYGSQGHEGEQHLWGYTLDGLQQLVRQAGWVVDDGRAFLSDNTQRPGMPCIEVTAHA